MNIRANIFDSLILVNNKLQQKEAAEALLAMAQLYETDATQVCLTLFVAPSSFHVHLFDFRSKSDGMRNFIATKKLYVFTKKNWTLIKMTLILA